MESVNWSHGGPVVYPGKSGGFVPAGCANSAQINCVRRVGPGSLAALLTLLRGGSLTPRNMWSSLFTQQRTTTSLLSLQAPLINSKVCTSCDVETYVVSIFAV